MPESADLVAQVATLTRRLDEVTGELNDQRAQLTRLVRAYGLDGEQLDRLRSFWDIWDEAAIGAHMRDVVSQASVLTDPFPHIVIEPLLPPDAFRLLLDAVPPPDFFEGKKHLDLRGLGTSATVMPLFSKAIWRSLRKDIVGPMLAPLLAERFRPYARDFLRISMGEEFMDEALSLPLYAHGFRLMMRRPGWELAPHLDPRDQFITTLLYLARPGEPETYGTRLFRVCQDNFVQGWANTYYPEAEGIRCELAKTMPYRGNLCLSFLNMGGGAHGASVPADAQPADLCRTVLQFYMGPDRPELESLVKRLPLDRQLPWTQRGHKRRSVVNADAT